MDVDELVRKATASPRRKGCGVCALTGAAADAVKRLEDHQREHGPDSVNKAQIVRDFNEAGIPVGPDAMRAHFRDHL